MRRFTNGPTGRNTARGVCFAFAFTFLLGPAVAPALAQEEVRYRAVPVAILDFENVSERPDPLLGRKAADALAVALDPERFDVLDRKQVQDELNQLGMTLPLDKDAQLRLGRQMKRDGIGVQGIITGQVRVAKVRRGTDGVYGEVQLAVTMLDVAVEEYVNGALEEARSTPKPGYTGDDDSLINEALATAADKVVRAMIDRRPAEAPVMTVTADSVLLGAGVRSGLYVGMKMVVVRFGEKVGVIQVTEVDSSHSTARIVENLRGISQRDKASAMYELPQKPIAQFGAPKTTQARSNKMKGLWGVVAGVALLALVGGSNKKAPTRGVTGGVVATSLANAADFNPGASMGVNLVTWKGPSRGSEDLLAHIIWRDGQLIWVQQPGEGYFFLDPVTLQLGPGESADYTANIQIDIDTGLLVLFNREGTLVETTPAQAMPAAAQAAHAANVARQALSWSMYTQDQTFSASWTATPATAGFHHHYQISRVGKVRILTSTTETTTTTGGTTTTTGGTTTTAMPPRAGQIVYTPTWVMRSDSPLSAVAGPATPIVPPALTSPVSNARPADPSAVAFTWAASEGADLYTLQISRDAQFLPENTVSIDAFKGILPGGTAETVVVDVASMFPGAGDQALEWRIGARYSGDQAPPRLQVGLNRPQDEGWVWSRPLTFIVGSAVPAAAGERAFVRPKRVPLRR